jgi:uncharacterized protein YjiS (DUF1127 family)
MNMDSPLLAAQSSVTPARGYTVSAKALLFYPIERLASWISSERAMRRGAAELRAMDDRLLADIGLTRDMVEYLARYGTLPRCWRDHL